MKKSEILCLTAMFLLFSLPWFIAGLNIWGWFAVCVCALVAGFEIFASIKYDKTISRIFWDFLKKHKKSAIGILVSISIAWVLLIAHLLNI